MEHCSRPFKFACLPSFVEARSVLALEKMGKAEGETLPAGS
uniref:Uncharacterized protein n=1 Tax=Setaria italica TaxID=4555 RepID=K4AN19_SETIT